VTDKARQTLADLTLAALTLFGAGLLFLGALSLPPPRFEPLGSAALPRILGGLLVLFAVSVAITAIRRRHEDLPVPKSATPSADPKRGALVLGVVVAYVFAMDVIQIPFLIATPLFVTASGLAIGGFSRRNLVAFAGLGIGLAFLISTVLERFLYVRIG
jgi:putative tricarboxylic transport membrane protein